MASIEVITGARLHAGLFSTEVNIRRPGSESIRIFPCPSPDKEPSSGESASHSMFRRHRAFGGVGMMVTSPRFRVVLERSHSQTDEYAGLGRYRHRVLRVMETLRASCRDGCQPPPCRVVVREGIPPHVGLGSGTQLALAVAAGMVSLAESEVDSMALALRVGRAQRCAVGTLGFANGGFVIDHGESLDDSYGSAAQHASLCDEWRLVLVRLQDEAGIAGTAERYAFASREPMSEPLMRRLRSLASDEMLPAVRSCDCEGFGEAMFVLNRLVGEYFAPVQGGIYASRQIEEMVNFLRDLGVHGVGQSSWGPTVFAVCPDSSTSEELVLAIRSDSRWADWSVETALPKNGGVQIAWNDHA